MRCLVMFITAVCLLFLLKLKWPKNKRKEGQNIVRFGAWDQESEKLESSLVPSDTLCGTPTVKT